MPRNTAETGAPESPGLRVTSTATASRVLQRRRTIPSPGSVVSGLIAGGVASYLKLNVYGALALPAWSVQTRVSEPVAVWGPA